MTVATCSYNDCTLTEEEILDPFKIGDEIVCDECYDAWRAENESECPFCFDRWLEDDLSECFVLVDAEFGEPGLYRPLRFPFYAQPLIGTPDLWLDAVERIGSLLVPAGIETGDCPAAYVCKECMGEKSVQSVETN